MNTSNAQHTPLDLDAISNMDDQSIRSAFSNLCEEMEKAGLVDIKFCIEGNDSNEAVQRQILMVEAMYQQGLTKEINDFELFNHNYMA